MKRPIIGVPTQTLDPIPGQSPMCWIVGQKYVQTLINSGAVPWVIPLLHDDSATLRAIYEHCDGIFLTGGVDVDPKFYNEDKHALCGRTDWMRDKVEIQLVHWARAEHKPVLGACRGVQVINVACGGTLYQDIGTQYVQEGAEYERPLKHDYFPSAELYTRDMLVHQVNVAPSTRLGRMLGNERVTVNSMHHQGVKKLADDLTATAWAPDGLIEGLEGRNGQYLVGVQWHPEELAENQAVMKRLFTTFIEAAGAAS